MRLTIKLKLALAFALLIGLTATVAGLGINSLSSLNTTMQEVLQGPMQRALWEEQLHRILLGIVRTEKNLILADTPQQIDAYDRELLQDRTAFTTLIERLDAIGSVEGRKRLAVLRTGFEHYVTVQDRLRALVRQGKAADARTLSASEARDLVHVSEGRLIDLIQLNQQYSTEAQAAAASHGVVLDLAGGADQRDSDFVRY